MVASVAGAQQPIGDIGEERCYQRSAEHGNLDGNARGVRRLSAVVAEAFHRSVFGATRVGLKTGRRLSAGVLVDPRPDAAPRQFAVSRTQER